MANNLLDYVGLGYFLSKIKTLFVTALGTSENNLTWTKNGTTNNITIPYAAKSSELVPLQTKQYTNIIGTANNNPGAVFYFMSIRPDDWNNPCRVVYKISAEMSGQAAGKAFSIISMVFSRNTVPSYDIWNYIGSTDYRPYYYHYRYLVTSTGYNNNYGHLMGIGMNSSYSPTSSTYARKFIVEVLELTNCSVTLFDSMTKYVSVPGTGSTNYSGEGTYDGTTNGETHSGDRNDVNYQNRELYASRITNSALGRYILCMTKSDGSLVPMNSVNNSIATDKTLTTDSFDPFGDIFYWSSTTTYSAGANVGNGSLYRLVMMDLRYSFNYTLGTFTAREPVYLVATPLSDGTAILYSNPLTQVLPSTEDGLIYIYLGMVYEDTSTYRINLSIHHPVYYYKNGAIRLWTNELDPVSPTINYVFIEGEEINIGELFGDRIEGYVRVSGISDPEMTYREYKRVSELSSVFSVFKPCLVGNNFTPQGTCGKILHVLDTLDWEHDVKGNVVSLDGSMGEVMICNTETIYVLLTVIEVDSVRYDTALYSKTPFEWNGYCAEEFKPMGIAPSYCVAHKDEDNVTRMHSVYNSNWNGSWSSPVDNEGKFVATDDGNGGIIETFDSSANIIGNASGKSSTNISLPVGEQYAMNLNDDTTKTVPYYNSHAWALEVMHVGLMLAEGGTFASHSVSLMGSGFSSNYAATAATYWNESNSDARNGFRYIKSDGTTWGYYSLGSNANFGNGATGDNLYKACMLNSWRTPWNIFEQQRVLMYAAANSIEELTWFAFEGNTYKYRSVEGFKGLSDGVMTAVVWKKVAAKLAANCVEPGTSNSVGGNRCEWLISSAVYRGVITDVSPSWWTSGLWMCQWGTDNTMHAYICKEQSKMVKSEQTSAVDEDVILPHENAEGYLPLQTLNATNGYAKDRSEETIFWPSSTSTQTGGGLNTYVGGYKYLGGTRPAEGEKLPRGFRRGGSAVYSYLSPVCVYGVVSPSVAASYIGFGTCCVIQT